MYCLDTNILIDLIRGDKVISEKINELNENIFINPITQCELFKGVYLSSMKDEQLGIVEELTESFEILEFNQDICKEFGKEYAKLSKSGKMIPEFDLIIGCFAKINNLILVTRDKKHFENLGIKLEVW